MSYTNLKEQQKVIDSHWNNGAWKYPCCGSEVLFAPNIQNAGEKETQIYCPYGCGYVFIEKKQK